MGKMYVAACLGLLACFYATAQSHPVQWSFSAKKVKDKVYELRFTAQVGAPWHIYSQSTPDGGPLPTKFQFQKNPLAVLEGLPKEQGKMVTKFEDVFELDVKYFDGRAEFVQIVTLRSTTKTNVKGTIEYMACNDQQCLPPTTIPFSIALN